MFCSQGVSLSTKETLVKLGLVVPDPIKPANGKPKDSMEGLGVVPPQPEVKLKPSEELERSMSISSINSESSGRNHGTFSPDLTKFADISISGDAGTKKNKVTKQDFIDGKKAARKESDPNDPLAQLDPFWTLKKDSK